MKTLIKQLIVKLAAKVRELDWRAIWQAAIPIIISGVFLKALGS